MNDENLNQQDNENQPVKPPAKPAPGFTEAELKALDDHLREVIHPQCFK